MERTARRESSSGNQRGFPNASRSEPLRRSGFGGSAETAGNNLRQVSILLTQYADWLSTLVYHISGRGFTHCSISLEEAPDTYYSFNYRGFAVETVEKHRRRGVKSCRCLQLWIPDEAYQAIRRRIREIRRNRAAYRYTRLGVFCCILQIPFRWRNHYFCSQFIAELLRESGAVPLKQAPCLYLPNRVAEELQVQPACRRVLCSLLEPPAQAF